MFRAIFNVYKQILVRRELSVLDCLKGMFVAVAWQLYKRIIGLPIIIHTFQDTSFILRPNCNISSRFVYEGRPDEVFVKMLSKFSGGDVDFVDVGANVGMYPALLCHDFESGWIFEPNPVAFEMARQNLAINGVTDKFKMMEAAVGSHRGTVKFPLLDIPLPTARVGDERGGKMIERDMVRLDELFGYDREYVIKIDAEGFDVEVIKGLKNLLSERLVRVCLFECHTNEYLKSIIHFLKADNDFDYEIMDGKNRIDNNDFVARKNRNRDLFMVRKDLVNAYIEYTNL
ncbi:MAG: FkbM family methyltransferase [Gammaproteobacteria bacterium]|nr:FkbM family methyltransferase [Gammaproteobacteria bacterium]MCF6337243.1 FkbM family methyltransferase [Gammaproteobacteria bacterium]